MSNASIKDEIFNHLANSSINPCSDLRGIRFGLSLSELGSDEDLMKFLDDMGQMLSAVNYPNQLYTQELHEWKRNNPWG
jgi:hypothetical protein